MDPHSAIAHHRRPWHCCCHRRYHRSRSFLRRRRYCRHRCHRHRCHRHPRRIRARAVASTAAGCSPGSRPPPSARPSGPSSPSCRRKDSWSPHRRRAPLHRAGAAARPRGPRRRPAPRHRRATSALRRPRRPHLAARRRTPSRQARRRLGGTPGAGAQLPPTHGRRESAPRPARQKAARGRAGAWPAPTRLQRMLPRSSPSRRELKFRSEPKRLHYL